MKAGLLAALLFSADFKDSFEDPPPPPAEPVPWEGITPACVWQMGWRPPGETLNNPVPQYGNCWEIFAPATAYHEPYDGARWLREAMEKARSHNKLIALSIASPYWAVFANDPDVVWLLAKDEPDGSISGNKGRCTAFMNGLKEAARLAPKKRRWCNFSSRNIRGVAYTDAQCQQAKGTPNEDRFCWDFDPMPLDACEVDDFPPDLCDIISYTPAYSRQSIGPYGTQLQVARARGMENGVVIDAYNGWDRDGSYGCGRPGVCEPMRIAKARQHKTIAEIHGNLAGYMIFLHPRPYGDRGCGTECQPTLAAGLAELFPPLPPYITPERPPFVPSPPLYRPSRSIRDILRVRQKAAPTVVPAPGGR